MLTVWYLLEEKWWSEYISVLQISGYVTHIRTFYHSIYRNKGTEKG